MAVTVKVKEEYISNGAKIVSRVDSGEEIQYFSAGKRTCAYPVVTTAKMTPAAAAKLERLLKRYHSKNR